MITVYNSETEREFYPGLYLQDPIGYPAYLVSYQMDGELNIIYMDRGAEMTDLHSYLMAQPGTISHVKVWKELSNEG